MPGTTSAPTTPKPFAFTTRELINVGVFSALYFVIIFGLGMIGFVAPVAMFFGWGIAIIIDGIVMALYVSRTPRFGAVTLLGLIVGLLMVVTGHWWATALLAVALGLISDAIIYRGGPAEHTMRRFPLGYAVMTVWFIAPLLPILINADAYFADMAGQMSAEYVEDMRALFQPWVLGVWTICLVILGLIGGVVGVRVGARHFRRAGLA